MLKNRKTQLKILSNNDIYSSNIFYKQQKCIRNKHNGCLTQVQSRYNIQSKTNYLTKASKQPNNPNIQIKQIVFSRLDRPRSKQFPRHGFSQRGNFQIPFQPPLNRMPFRTSHMDQATDNQNRSRHLFLVFPFIRAPRASK